MSPIKKSDKKVFSIKVNHKNAASLTHSLASRRIWINNTGVIVACDDDDDDQGRAEEVKEGEDDNDFLPGKETSFARCREKQVRVNFF